MSEGLAMDAAALIPETVDLVWRTEDSRRGEQKGIQPRSPADVGHTLNREILGEREP